ncbi:ubiquitin-like-specific protease 1A [Rosa rugosa]|uniref:ubiquitin-like-specific protease 1A n=1 Tax=Rosa rugosa TaxID=74645 RepID=UPI002B403385|nr:ubiquitin-like-specific protease 1A [Rosa rugosa]
MKKKGNDAKNGNLEVEVQTLSQNFRKLEVENAETEEGENEVKGETEKDANVVNFWTQADKAAIWQNKESETSIKSEDDIKHCEHAAAHEHFIPLTDEEHDAVEKAFSSADDEVLVTDKSLNIKITGENFRCLKPRAWLNDEVINVYLKLLKEREKRDPNKFLKCHFFSTFFYKKLINEGKVYNSVRRWTSKHNLGYSLIDCDKIFVPIHKGDHWCLAVINKADQKFQYLDSRKGKDEEVMEVLAKYYVDELKDKSEEEIDVSFWKREFVKDLPEDFNRFDCGMFMIKYADYYSKGSELCFNQDDMPHFRLKTAKEILQLRAE